MDVVSARAKAYDNRIRATVAVLEPVHFPGEARLSGYLGGLLGWKPSDSSSQVELTLFLSDVHKGPRKRQRINVEDDNCQSPDHHLPENETANDIQETDPSLCGNCGSDDHKAAVCIKVGKSGWMEACCKCDSLQHTYDHCPHRRQEEDFKYLILNRGNKGPVKCSLHLGRVVLLELNRADSPYRGDNVVALPYSSTFSRQSAQINRYYSWSVMQDKVGNLVEPARMNQLLGRAVSILRDQRWTIEDHEIDRAEHPCDNCQSPDHSVYQCSSDCGFCGSYSHQTWFCEHRDKTCCCSKYPRHSRGECRTECWYCELVQSNNGDHSVNWCPKICHYCLESDHITKMCEVAMKAEDRACPHCPTEAHHYPSVHMICPGASCKRLIEPSPCNEHCLDCG